MSNITDIRLSGTTYQLIDATAIHSLDGYYTTGETNAAITAATDALAQAIAEQGYQTSGDVQNAISGKANSDDVYTKQETEDKIDEKIAEASGVTTGQVQTMINESISGKANTSDVVKNVYIDGNSSGQTSGNNGQLNIKIVKGNTTGTTQDVIGAKDGLYIQRNSYNGADIYVDFNTVAAKSDIPAVTGYADAVRYDPQSQEMKFYHGGIGGTEVFSFDASPFLIDGMVQNVEIKNVPGTQTFQTGYEGMSPKSPFQASNYDSSATNAVGDYSSFDFSTGKRYFTLKVMDSSNAETTVCNGASSFTTTEYATFTTQDNVVTIVPASGYKLSYIDMRNIKESGGMPISRLCDWTVTAATTCLVISFNTDAGHQDINIPISQIFDASNYYTKSETDTKISQSVSDRVSKYTYTAYTANTQSVLNAKADTTAMTQAISEATSGKADTTAVTQSITEAVSGKADTTAVTQINDALTAHTSNTDIHVTTSDKSTWSGKQDALVNQVNIKSVGGNSLLGSGDIAFPAGLQVEVSGTTLVFS